MKKLNDIIAQLQAQQAHLEREKRKIAFLNHILQSVKEYHDAEFQDVHSDVLALVSDFVTNTIANIETAEEPKKASSGTSDSSATEPVPAPRTEPAPRKAPAVGPAEMMAFALEYRHLSGKSVVVTPPAGHEPIKGSVVGLEAPFVLVKTEAGPTIKVPVESLGSWS